MFVIISRPAIPGDYVIHRDTGDIRKVRDLEYNSEDVFFGYEEWFPNSSIYWEREEYYVLQQVYDFDIPQKLIPLITKSLKSIIRHYYKAVKKEQNV